MPLNKIDWSGVYARRPVVRAYAETRIRQHYHWFQAMLGKTVQAKLRYVFPSVLLFIQITFADPPAGTETAAVQEEAAISPSIFIYPMVHSTVLAIFTATQDDS